MALCLPRPGVCLLAWVAPAVLLYCLRDAASSRAAVGLGALFGFAYTGIVLRWIFATCRFAGVPLPVSVLAMLALAGVLCLNWALFGFLVKYSTGRSTAASRPWIWAMLAAAIESASAHWGPRVGVDLLAYTQYRYLPMIQLGAVFGPHGLGFLIMLWGGAMAEYYRHVKLRGTSAIPGRNLAFAGLLVFAVAAYGEGVLSTRAPYDKNTAQGARVEILQPNIDQYRKWDENYVGAIKASFDGLLSAKRAARPDLVIWPESSAPGWLAERRVAVWLQAWARRLGPMLVGAVAMDEGRAYNAAVLFGKDGRVHGRYDKRRLVPFGEFVPLRGLFAGWIGILAQMGGLEAGRLRQPLMRTRLGVLGVSICYEAMFPHLVRIDAARGARVIANLTNDGWYKDTAGPIQHFHSNVFRAVENRVTVLRAANTGISGVIDPYGVILARTEIETRDRLDLRLAADDPFPRASFYARHGDWFGIGMILAASAFLLAPLLRRLAA